MGEDQASHHASFGHVSRGKIVAATLLGALHPRRKRFCTACRLHPLEPGETRFGKMRGGLALFDLSSLCCGWHIPREFGSCRERVLQWKIRRVARALPAARKYWR